MAGTNTAEISGVANDRVVGRGTVQGSRPGEREMERTTIASYG
jgi:hypothetical protein